MNGVLAFIYIYLPLTPFISTYNLYFKLLRYLDLLFQLLYHAAEQLATRLGIERDPTLDDLYLDEEREELLGHHRPLERSRCSGYPRAAD